MIIEANRYRVDFMKEGRDVMTIEEETILQVTTDQGEPTNANILKPSSPALISSKAAGDASAVMNHTTLDLPEPSPYQVNKYIALWDGRENYTLQEKALDKLFFYLCPTNNAIEDVLLKAAVLNDFYSTNIYSIFPVAKHIVALNIDDRLSRGDETLVDDIKKVIIGTKVKCFYSFATKYCSHHKPDIFPIYDSYVDCVLRYFREKDHFAIFSNAELRNYEMFKRLIIAFQQYYHLNEYGLKDIDRYLWQLGKDYFSKYKK